MSKNRTGKYLKYAIGEILLVVIGILIALQINNWNEERKVQNKLLDIYSRINKDSLTLKIIEVYDTMESQDGYS